MRDQLMRSYEREAWSGPSVREALGGVTPAVAWARPGAGGHTIAELVLHMAVWKRVVAARIAGGDLRPGPAEDWRDPGSASEAAWRAACDDLEEAHRALERAVAALDDDALDRPTADGLSAYVLVHGAIQHDLYHAGQVMLLRRLLGA